MSKDGGPAFPLTVEMTIEGQTTKETQGMTLRDYLAAKALIVAHSYMDNKIEYEGLASTAYEIADAMLAERNKHE